MLLYNACIIFELSQSLLMALVILHPLFHYDLDGAHKSLVTNSWSDFTPLKGLKYQSSRLGAVSLTQIYYERWKLSAILKTWGKCQSGETKKGSHAAADDWKIYLAKVLRACSKAWNLYPTQEPRSGASKTKVSPALAEKEESIVSLRKAYGGTAIRLPVEPVFKLLDVRKVLNRQDIALERNTF